MKVRKVSKLAKSTSSSCRPMSGSTARTNSRKNSTSAHARAKKKSHHVSSASTAFMNWFTWVATQLARPRTIFELARHQRCVGRGAAHLLFVIFQHCFRCGGIFFVFFFASGSASGALRVSRLPVGATGSAGRLFVIVAILCFVVVSCGAERLPARSSVLTCPQLLEAAQPEEMLLMRILFHLCGRWPGGSTLPERRQNTN